MNALPNQLVMRYRRSPRRGLTLLELLVVLVILAVVATVAVNSLEPRLEGVRYEQTKKEIKHVASAVVGEPMERQADGTPIISGFIADVGRMPAVENFESGMELSQLWNLEGSLASKFPFQFRSGPKSPVDLSDIRLPCGWRGPYLQLGLGTGGLQDAWARPYLYDRDALQNVQAIRWDPIKPYDNQVVCDFRDGFVSVSGMIVNNGELAEEARVFLLTPDPEQSVVELAIMEDQDSSPGSFSFVDVPIGLRAICVVVGEKKTTRYVHVTHQGLSLSIDISGLIE